MPKKPEIPEHWKEDYEEPQEQFEEEMEAPVIYDDKERDLLNDQGTHRMDMVLETNNGNELDQELARLKLKKQEKEQEKQKKADVKQKKAEIRQLKYEPVYDAGEKLKKYGSKLGGFISKKRGTPSERAEKGAKAKATMKKLGNVARKKAVSFGKSMQENKKAGGFQSRQMNISNRKTNDMFSGSVGSNILGANTCFFDKKINIMHNQRAGLSNIPRILQGDLLGKTKNTSGKGKKKPSNKKTGLKLMNERIKL